MLPGKCGCLFSLQAETSKSAVLAGELDLLERSLGTENNKWTSDMLACLCSSVYYFCYCYIFSPRYW